MTKVNYQIWSKTFVNNRRKSRDQGMQGNQLSLTSHMIHVSLYIRDTRIVENYPGDTWRPVEWKSVGKASAYAFQYVIKHNPACNLSSGTVHLMPLSPSRP